MQFFSHNGDFSVYRSKIALFHTNNLGIFIFSNSIQKTQPFYDQIIFNITDTFLNPFNCTGFNFQTINNTCFQNLIKFSPYSKGDFQINALNYVGCYSDSRYEHTTWFKPFNNYIATQICITLNINLL
jgi:hypothetical protein